jgi:hypothetical protein
MGLITLELNEDEARLIGHALGKALGEGSLAEPPTERTNAICNKDLSFATAPAVVGMFLLRRDWRQSGERQKSGGGGQ